MSTQASTGVSPEDGGTPEFGFEIDDEVYHLPELHTLVLDEEEILFRLAGCIVQDFIPAHPNWDEETTSMYNFLAEQRVRDPRVKGTLAYIAYRRKHPGVSEKEGLEIVGKVNALTLDVALFAPEDDASPPAPSSQNEHSPKSEHTEPTKPILSGSSIDASLGEAAWTQPRIGITGSDTSSPLSLDEISGI